MTGPIAVSVIAGLDADTTSLVASGLVTRAERCAVIAVDPTTADRGYVLWRVEDGDGRAAAGRLFLVGDCLSCAVRAAVITRLVELRSTGRYTSAVVVLHPAIEVDAALTALCAGLPPDVARLDTIVTVLDAATWLDDLAGDADLRSRGAALGPDDVRGVAGVLASSLDVADRIVLLAPGPAAQRVPSEQWIALRALAPDALRIVPPTALDVAPSQVLETAAHDPRCLHPLAERGLSDWRRAVVQSDSLRVVRWSRPDRPLHPARVAAAMDHLADGVFRSAGHLWFAHAHDAIVRWDSCGDELHLGAVARFENAGAIGGNRLALLGDDLDRDAITAHLDACVLTDDEMDRPPQAWAGVDHPLPAWQPEPPEDTA